MADMGDKTSRIAAAAPESERRRSYGSIYICIKKFIWVFFRTFEKVTSFVPFI
jgi:hypothetical protein